MLFEVIVLVVTTLNALDRPHQAALPIAKVLYRDGISYFLVRITHLITPSHTDKVPGRHMLSDSERDLGCRQPALIGISGCLVSSPSNFCGMH